MNHILRLGAIVLSCAMVMTALGCGTSRTATRGASDDEEASDADILRLLGVEGEGEQRPAVLTAPEQLAARIASLESALMSRESEINELKAELVLKDERIEELATPFGGGRIVSPPSPARMTTVPRNFREFESEYQRTLNLYHATRYREGIGGFQQLLVTDMNNSLSDNCQYWMGECYYALKDFRQAVVEFEKVFTFANSNKDDDAQLKLGLCYINLGDATQARVEFNRLLTNYPDSEYVGRAQHYLGQIQ